MQFEMHMYSNRVRISKVISKHDSLNAMIFINEPLKFIGWRNSLWMKFVGFDSFGQNGDSNFASITLLYGLLFLVNLVVLMSTLFQILVFVTGITRLYTLLFRHFNEFILII